MTDPSARTFRADFKRFFLRGLVVLLPSVLTLWIVVKAYQFIDSAIADPINRGVRLAMIEVAPYWEPLRKGFDPDEQQLAIAAVDPITKSLTPEQRRARLRAENIHRWWADHWYMNLIGLIVAIVSVYVAGRVLGGFLGRRVYRRIEQLITSLPVFKQVYPYVKQIVDFLFSDDKQLKFSRVVAIEYPRMGLWSIGFMTAGAVHELLHSAGDSVTVFIPSSPTPFTGYAVVVPRAGVIEMSMSVDEAIRFIVSCGVLIPDPPQEGASPNGMAFTGLIPIRALNVPETARPEGGEAPAALTGQSTTAGPRRPA